MDIRRATRDDLASLLDMAASLWPDDPEEQIKQDVRDMLSSKNQTVFICREKDCYSGFIDVSIRKEYVPGATVFPLGYVEGIYVKPAFRRKGVAQSLLAAGERWALEQGCNHMASDTWVWNDASRKFHTGTGFKETETVVYFIKKLGQDGCEPAPSKKPRRS